jgi:hypothetical protein
MNFSAPYIGFSANGSAWTNVSGSSGGVVVEGGEVQIGEAYTADGNYPLTKVGKMANVSLRIRIVYSEVTGEAYAMAKTAYEGLPTANLYVRWSPGGGGSGDFGYTSAAGYVTLPPYPGGNADDPNPIVVEVNVATSTITQSTIGTAGWLT